MAKFLKANCKIDLPSCLKKAQTCLHTKKKKAKKPQHKQRRSSAGAQQDEHQIFSCLTLGSDTTIEDAQVGAGSLLLSFSDYITEAVSQHICTPLKFAYAICQPAQKAVALLFYTEVSSNSSLAQALAAGNRCY
jgi:hypothetical protein